MFFTGRGGIYIKLRGNVAKIRVEHVRDFLRVCESLAVEIHGCGERFMGGGFG